jgi:hypothetical protein
MRDNARRRRGAVKFDFHIARCMNLTFLEHSSASAHERQSCSGLGGARASLAHAARHSTSMNLWFLTHSPSRAHCSHFSGVAAPRAPRAPRCPAAKRKQSRRILPLRVWGPQGSWGASRLVGPQGSKSSGFTRCYEARPAALAQPTRPCSAVVLFQGLDALCGARNAAVGLGNKRLGARATS